MKRFALALCLYASTLFAADGSFHTDQARLAAAPTPSAGVGNTTVTITSSQTWTVPAGVTSLIIECWGGGGGSGKTTSGEGGGGGGAYSLKTLTVSPLDVIWAGVGAAGTRSADVYTSSGGDSFVVDVTGTLQCLAAGGVRGSSRNGGVGGSAANSTGDTKFSGGNGGSSSGIAHGGGGGGSSAGTGSGGNNGATVTTGTSAGAGGTGPTGGFAGGAGGAQTANGSNGTGVGAGGGGGGDTGGTGGSGIRGEIHITYANPATQYFPSVLETYAQSDVLPYTTINNIEIALGYRATGTTTSLDYLARHPLGSNVFTVGTGCRYATIGIAAAAATAAGGTNIILVMPGTYNEQQATRMPDNTSLVSYQYGAAKIRKAAAGDITNGLIQLGNNCAIRGFDIETINNIPLIVDGTNCVVENNTFGHCVDYLWVGYNADGGITRIRNNYFSTCDWDGFSLGYSTSPGGTQSFTSASTVVEIAGNTIRGTASNVSQTRYTLVFSASGAAPQTVIVRDNDIDVVNDYPSAEASAYYLGQTNTLSASPKLYSMNNRVKITTAANIPVCMFKEFRAASTYAWDVVSVNDYFTGSSAGSVKGAILDTANAVGTNNGSLTLLGSFIGTIDSNFNQTGYATLSTGTATTKGTVTLSGNSEVTVTTTDILTGDTVLFSGSNVAVGSLANYGQPVVTAITNGTSFKVASTNNSDTRTLRWEIKR